MALDRAASAGRAGGRQQQAELVQRPRHLLHGLRERHAVARRSDRGRAGRRSNRRPTRCPTRRRSIEKATEFMHLLRPSATALRTVAPPLGHAFAEGAVNLDAATALNTRLAESSQALRRVRQQPRRHARPSKTSRRRSKSATRCSPGSRPSRPSATTDARVPQHREPRVRRASAWARSRAPARARARTAPTTRASRPRRPPTAPRPEHAAVTSSRSPTPTTTTCTSTPTRTSAAPGSAAGLRSGQRELRRPAAGDRQPARERRRRPTAKSPAAKTDLFGETYPAATLKALGCSQSPSKAEAKARAEGKKK